MSDVQLKPNGDFDKLEIDGAWYTKGELEDVVIRFWQAVIYVSNSMMAAIAAEIDRQDADVPERTKANAA